MLSVISRYEYKYIISESLAREIADYTGCFASPDRYTLDAPPEGYRITSLYLDTPHLLFHRAKERKESNRFKLRVRGYGDVPRAPYFFEVKRKLNGVIHKTRAMVAEEDWQRDADRLHLLLGAEARELDHRGLGEFSRLKAIYNAGPSVLVSYTRTAWESHLETYGRVTFDRRLRCAAPSGYELTRADGLWSYIDDPVSTELAESGLVLELKFAQQAPRWMADLVQRFGIRNRGFSKYSTSVEWKQGRYGAETDSRVPTVAGGWVVDLAASYGMGGSRSIGSSSRRGV